MKKNVVPKKPDIENPWQKDIFRNDPIITDPQGSYTGRPLERYEMPVQDADDL